MKKLFALALALIMALAIVPVATMAEEETGPAQEFVIDGNLDVWYMEENEADLTDLTMYAIEPFDVFSKVGGNGPYMEYETYAKVWTAYDDNYVYFYVKCWDDTLRPYIPGEHADSSYGDSIEVWFDPDPNSQSTYPDGTPREVVTDGWYNQTSDPTQGDVQFRVGGHGFLINDYHNVKKLGYGDTLFGEYITNRANLMPFYFDNDPMTFENQVGQEFTIDKGYGIEVRLPRNDDKAMAYRFNIACNNSAEFPGDRYALATANAWWLDYGMAPVVSYQEENPFFMQDVSGKQVWYASDSDGNKAGQAVVDKIEALPDPATEDDRTAVQAAVDAYVALSPIQRGFVKQANYDKLAAAAEALGIEMPEEQTDPDPGPGPGPDPQPGEVKYGDVNGDKEVDAKDALLVLKAAVGKETLTDAQKKAADVNVDNAIDAKDALDILKFAVGKLEHFKAETQK